MQLHYVLVAPAVSLAVLPSIPALPVVSDLAAALQATSVPTAGLLPEAATQSSANTGPISWLLSSMSQPSPTLLQSERVALDPSLPSVPKSLLERIQRWDYVDLIELLPTYNIHDALSRTQAARFPLFLRWEFVHPKRRQIESILEWVQAFTIYAVALVKKFPKAVMDIK